MLWGKLRTPLHLNKVPLFLLVYTDTMTTKTAVQGSKRLVREFNCGLFDFDPPPPVELCPLFVTFLAAMSSSRSDDVTQSVCVSVRPSLFFLLVFLKFLLVFKSFNDVSRVFKGCLKFKGSFKDVSRKF